MEAQQARDELDAIKSLRWRSRDEALSRVAALAALPLEAGLAAEVQVERCLLQLLAGQAQASADGLDAVLVDLDAQAHPRPWIHAMNLRASILMEQGERVQATTLFTAAWRLARDTDLPRELHAVAANLAVSLEELQAHEAADRLLVETLEALEAHPDLAAHSPHLAHQRVRLLRASPPRAREVLEAWRARMLASPRLGPAVLAVTESELLLLEGRAGDALQMSTSIDREQLPPGHRAEAELVHAQALTQLGELEEARVQLEALRPRVEELSAHALLPRVRRALADVHQRSRDFERASTLWREEAEYQRSHVVGQLGPAIERLGRRYLDEVDHLRLVELAEARDASERKGRLLEEAWRRAEAEAASRKRMLSEISHELRNPLHGLLGLIARVESGRHPEAAARLRAPTELMLAIVEDVLTLGHLEARRLETVEEPTALRPVLEDTAALVRAQGGRELRLELQPGLPQAALLDPHRLQQILLNLLGNAMKFARSKVVLRVHANSRLVFEVEDDGPGVPEQARERVFQPWEQADTSVQHRVGGTGLGLSIARRLARRLGGNLELAPADPSRGALFRLALPLVHTALPSKEPTSTSPLERLQPPLLVVLVEDDPVARQVSQDLLLSLGVHVRALEDGLQLTKIVQETRPDLVLVDLHLPQHHGTELARQLRNAGCERFLVAHSASVLAEDHEAAREAGFDAFLPKPIRRTHLRTTLEGWVPRLRPDPDAG